VRAEIMCKKTYFAIARKKHPSLCEN